MLTYLSDLILEIKRLAIKKNLAIWGLLLLVCLFILFKGILGYKNEAKSETDFKKFEGFFFQKIINYWLYSFYGTNYFFQPPGSSAFFAKSGLFSEAAANTDTLNHLKITNNLKTKSNLKRGGALLLPDWAWAVFITGSFLSMLYGFFLLKHKEYLKFLSSHTTERRSFVSNIAARITIIAGVTVVSYIIAVLFALAMGIRLPLMDLIHLCFHLGTVILGFIFFFLLGVWVGGISYKMLKGLSLLFSAWCIVLFLIPWAIYEMILDSPNDNSHYYNDELKKFFIMMSFENHVLKESKGKVNAADIKSRRKYAEIYFTKDYLQIQAVEQKLKKEMEQDALFEQGVSMFTPGTFFSSVSSEMGGKGYRNLLRFYGYLIEMKRKLLRHWFDQIYYKDPKVMVNFIKKDENVFRAKSMLPHTFWAGIIINLLYAAGLMFMAYRSYVKTIHRMDEKKFARVDGMQQKLLPRSLNIFQINDGLLPPVLYNLLGGKSAAPGKLNLKGEVEFGGKELYKLNRAHNFLYMINPRYFPCDIFLGDLISLIAQVNKIPRAKMARIFENKRFARSLKKRMREITTDLFFEITLEILDLCDKNKNTYLLNDVAKELPLKKQLKLYHRVRQWNKKGKTVIFLTTCGYILIKDLPRSKVSYQNISEVWLYGVKIQKINARNNKNKC